MSPISIAALKEQAGEKPIAAAVLAQLQHRQLRTTKTNKPYLELGLADATGSFSIKIWSDSPAYAAAESLPDGGVTRLQGRWTAGQYGLEAKELELSLPDDAARDAFFAGDPGIREKQGRDYALIEQLCDSIGDPRLHALCAHFLTSHGERFRRTAAAKRNHHARRGGLVEHVAQMMRAAAALCPVYPELNRDLLLTAVLFHDCGKLWENSYPERGFNQLHSLHGEMLGHIPLGIELVNKLWREVQESAAAGAWETLMPPTEEARLHLLHLIGSHHGEYQFGSPVLPRTPEAFALHHLDNLDAKLEMVRDAYALGRELAPGIYDRMFPLQNNLVRPLAGYSPPEKTENQTADGPDPAAAGKAEAAESRPPD
ncbi:MAG: HD domain-containing protein [Akkermansiaceae bacterium]|nr:HD domain-containing protein [Akkermansiaceae bacterium]